MTAVPWNAHLLDARGRLNAVITRRCVIQRQSTDPAKSITSADVSVTDTLTMLIKVPATVTFYRGHRRTFCCLPGIISLIIICVEVIFT